MRSVVLIHGFLGSPNDWSDVRSELRFASLAAEIPRAETWQQGLASVYRQLAGPCVVVGYSMGARLAMGCALSDPKRKIRGAVLIAGNPGLNAEQRPLRWQHDLGVCHDLQRKPVEEFLRDWYRQEVFRSLSDAEFESVVKDRRDLKQQDQIELMQTYSVAKQPDYWCQLSELKIPVGVVVGELDEKYVGISRKMVERIPNAQLHVAPGCGHMVHRERKAWLVTMLNEFVASLPKET